MNKQCLLTTANDVKSAIIVVCDLFDRGERNILVTNNRASNAQFDKLNKQLREMFYCQRVEEGFIVRSRRTAPQNKQS